MLNDHSVVVGDETLIAEDIILPVQYFGSVHSRGLSGEQRLMLAVMVNAINFLPSWKGDGSPCKRRNFAEAVQWVNTRGTSHPFSFDSVCDALEIYSEMLHSRAPVNSPSRQFSAAPCFDTPATQGTEPQSTFERSAATLACSFS